MIVRLMGEGQWRVDDDLAARLEELDADTERAVEAGDEEALQAALRALHDAVRDAGEKLDHAHLSPSDAVVPPLDLTLDEARRLLASDDSIPDLP
jgi:chromosome condensin MukBEF complex kleisin-like MukF subunit